MTAEQLARTFQTNVFGYYFMTKAALPHLKPGAAIVNTTSVTAYRGSSHLMDRVDAGAFWSLPMVRSIRTSHRPP